MALWTGIGACFIYSMHQPGIVVPPGMVHQKKKKEKKNNAVLNNAVLKYSLKLFLITNQSL